MSRLGAALWFMAGLVSVSFPLQVSAEMLGEVPCTNPSWNSLATGACRPGEVLGPRPPSGGTDHHASGLVAAEGTIGMIPEPQTYALMLAGLAVVIGIARKRRRS